METLLKEIDLLVDNIKADTNRTKLADMGIKLIELTRTLSEAKQEYIRAKNEYDRDTVMKMESWKQHLEQEEEKRFIAELENNPKAKRNKISNVKTSNMVELELIGLKYKVAEAKMVVEYLEPLIRGYRDLVNIWEFLDRASTGDQKFYSQQQ